MSVRVVVAWLAGALAPGWALAQSVVPQPPAAVAPVVDRTAAARGLIEREAEKQKLVGLSVCVAKDGRVVLEHHVGFEDREAKTAASAQTMYRWASISKPVTATAAMMLVESGKLDLDDDVRTLVPAFPAKPWTITPRQLLCHQGGVVHYSNGNVVGTPAPKNPSGSPLPAYADVVKALDTFKDSPLVCEPGTTYSYTTHGYMLLGAAVQGAAGRSYWSVVREWIAQPAGMTTFRPDYQWEKIEHRAVGYVKDKSGEVKRSTDTDVSWKLPGGGFVSTVSDLSRFSVALMNGVLVKPETFQKMRTPQKLRDGTATTYGLGLGVGKLDGHATASHGGAQEKVSSFLLMVPERRLSVAVMSNSEGASLGGLAEALVREWLSDAPSTNEPGK